MSACVGKGFKAAAGEGKGAEKRKEEAEAERGKEREMTLATRRCVDLCTAAMQHIHAASGVNHCLRTVICR